MSTPEAEQLEAVRARQEGAWAELHREHFSRLWNSVNRIVNNASIADDIVQETFVKAYRDIERFEAHAKLGTWLYRIAINQALDHTRKEQRRGRWLSFLSPIADEEGRYPSLPEAPVAAVNSLGLENAELRETILEAMGELSAEHRAVVQLRLVDELSLEETAALLKCKAGTVNSRLHYACDQLRRKLKLRLDRSSSSN